MNNLKLSSQGTQITSENSDVAFSVAPRWPFYLDESIRVEIAKRIVACVNACEGFDTEGLVRSVEIGETLPVMRDRMIKRELDLQMQRDELLAALEDCAYRIDCKIVKGEATLLDIETAKKAHALIARAKGGAA